MTASPSPGPASGGEAFFSAFRADKQKQRPRWILPTVIAVAALALVIGFLFARQSRDAYQIVTPRGMRVVSLGMTSHDVGKQLGTPMGVEKQDGKQCLRYGYPSFEEPWFLVHVACFDGDKLVSMSTRRFKAEKMAAPGEPGGLPRPEPAPAQ